MKLVQEISPSLIFCYFVLVFSSVVGFNIFSNYDGNYEPEKNDKGIFDKFNEKLKKMNNYQGVIGMSGVAIGTTAFWTSIGDNPPESTDRPIDILPPDDSTLIHILQYIHSFFQLEIVAGTLSDSMDDLTHTSNNIENTFFHNYYSGQDMDVFTEQLLQKLENSEYGSKNNISDILKYVYVMDVQCNFLFYPHEEYMTRTDTQILETCVELQNNETIFTNVYPSTGTQSFVASYGQTIDVNNDGLTDFILVVASDIGGISERIHDSFLPGFEGKVIVEDRQDHVVVSCSDNCDNLENPHINVITQYTQPISLDSLYLDSYPIHISKTITDDENPLNGYIIHVYDL